VGNRQDRLFERLAGHAPRNIKRFRFHPFVAMTVDAAGLAALLADPDVVSISEDRRLYPQLNDTPTITRANKAWLAGYRGAGQTVAILDTGVDTAHPFFAGKIVAEACFSQAAGPGFTSYCPNPSPPSPQFPGTHQIGPGAGINCPDLSLTCWHGTHVAGIAAGRTNVMSASAGGMAPDAQIIPIQVFQKDCSSGTCSIVAFDSDLMRALEYVYTLRNTYNIAAANMSLGGGVYTAACDASAPGLTSIINTLRNTGIATIVSTGNGGSSIGVSFPACIAAAVSVGSTTKSNTLSGFSNSSSLVELLAPGSAIVSSMPGGGFSGANGTSMAAPHVAGAWASLKSARPNASVAEILAALQSSGLPIIDSRNGVTKPLIQIGYDNVALGALGTLLGHGNLPPTIAITAPGNGASFVAPASITFSVNAADSDGGVSKVEYFSGGAKIFESTMPPYGFTWTNVPAGAYVLTAVATDVLGGTATSAPVNINVNGNPGQNVDTVWVDDAIPAGAITGGNEAWTWVNSNPTPFSGAQAHRSATVSGIHQHFFNNASATLSVGVGDSLFTHVYLDPANPPAQVMLQWNDGSWEHRAYWGANLIAWGTDGSASRRYMGPLPAAGQWVRLEVPAALVGLEGRTVAGMAFTLYNGRATWDRSGKSSAQAATSFTINGTVTAGGSALAGVNFSASNGATCTPSNTAGQYSCTVPQGYGGTVTPSLNGYTFTPPSRSYSNVSANQNTQDFAAAIVQSGEVVWVEDALPASATSGGNEAWTWVNANPAPFSGGASHRSSVAAGMHQHFFSNAAATLSVSTGDTLFAYVYLFPSHLPRQIMLQWNDGTWDHRAYWGENLINWGVDGTASRRYMGPLPPAGQWVRLEVPAALVGVEGRVLNGMAFTLFDGQAAWDRAGKTSGAAATTHTLGGTVTASSTPLSGVTFDGGAGAACNTSNALGQYSCTVASGYSGAITPSLDGYTFTPSTRNYSNVTADQAGQNYTAAPTQASDVVWIDDAIPAGAIAGGNEAWTWVNSNPAPYAGTVAHRSAHAAGMHQHHFNNASATLTVAAGETLFAYVYLDPANPPRQVMLQWNDGNWEHRAYWGENLRKR